MNDDSLLPTPEYRAFLEYEMLRTFRHETRRERAVRWMRTTTVAIVFMAIGGTAGLASAQIKGSTRRDSLLASAATEGILAGARVEIAEKQLADVTHRVQVGAAGIEMQHAAERELGTMQARLNHLALDIMEIRVTSEAPRDDLNAPLVGERDFVRDRIQVELTAAQQQLVAAEATLAEADRRTRIGASPESARLEAAVGVARAEAAFNVLAQKLALRKEYLEKGTPVDQLLRRLDEAQVQQDMIVVRSRMGLAQDRLKQVERQRAVGVATEVDLLRAQLEVKEAEADMRALAQRAQTIRPAGTAP